MIKLPVIKLPVIKLPVIKLRLIDMCHRPAERERQAAIGADRIPAKDTTKGNCNDQ